MVIVIPMAGHGERFRIAGYSVPKPLIDVQGRRMFVRATDSLPLSLASRLVFVVLEKHVSEYHLDEEIYAKYGNYPLKIVKLESVTSGQAETVARAIDGECESEPLLIFNADSAFQDDLQSYFELLPPDIAGVLQVFSDTDQRWSFVRTDNSLKVVETAEKVPISAMASTGLYYFRSCGLFKCAYADLARNLTGGERFIAPMYNYIIKQGMIVMAKPIKKYYCFGTPSDLNNFINGKYYGS